MLGQPNTRDLFKDHDRRERHKKRTYNDKTLQIASVAPSPRFREILCPDFIGVEPSAAATSHHRIKHQLGPIARASTQWN